MKRWPIYLNIAVISLFLVAQLGTLDAYPLVPRDSDVDDTGSVIYNPKDDDSDSDSDYTRIPVGGKGGNVSDSDSDSDDDPPSGDDVTVIYNPRPEDSKPDRPVDTSAKEDNDAKTGVASEFKDDALKQINASPSTDHSKASKNKADKGDDTASNNSGNFHMNHAKTADVIPVDDHDVNKGASSSDSLAGANKDTDSATEGKGEEGVDGSKKKNKTVSFNNDVDVITTGNDGAAEGKSNSEKGDESANTDLISATQGKGKESEKNADEKTTIDDAPTKVPSGSGTSGNQDSATEGKSKENGKSAVDKTTADNVPTKAVIDPDGATKGNGKKGGNSTTIDNGDKKSDKGFAIDQGNVASNNASDGKGNGKSPTNDDTKGKGGVSDQGGAIHDASGGGKGDGEIPEDEPKAKVTDAGKKDDASGADKPKDSTEQGANFMTVDSFRFDLEKRTGKIDHKLKVALLTGGARLGKPEADKISRKFFVVSADSDRRTIGILKIVNLKRAARLHGQDAVDAMVQEGAFWKQIGDKKLMWEKKIKDDKTGKLVEYRILYRAMYGMVENSKDDKNPLTLNLKFMHEWAFEEDWDERTMLPKCQDVAYQKHKRLALDRGIELSKFGLLSWVTDKECDHWFPYEVPPSYVFRDPNTLSRVTVRGAKWMSPDTSKRKAYLKDLKTRQEFTKHFTEIEVKTAQQEFQVLQRGIVAA